MKLRNGFVSNSSSSSFIVISNKGELRGKNEYANTPMVVDKNLGECEFGWGPEKITDFGSRIIFSFLQTLYSDPSGSRLRMLEKVIKEHTGTPIIIWKVGLGDSEYGYIDHASSAGEGMNLDMFNTEEDLRNFLFNTKSCIMLDNDNH